MNILFFLTPKKDVGFVYSSDTVGEAIEKMLRYKFTTVPVINENSGRYEGTLANDDLLRELYYGTSGTVSEIGNKPLKSVTRRRDYGAVRADADMEDLLATAAIQNFVPVVDDTGAFIGIITRREVMNYLREHLVKDLT
ncbi:MAG: CBS domain-containing protein [Lachnospiraceae bacterium]|nr:CBS domain-containing protein [Lachnospiraceae bacterium]